MNGFRCILNKRKIFRIGYKKFDLVRLSLKNFDTINVKDFDLTFGFMQNVQELDLSNYRISVKSDKEKGQLQVIGMGER